MGLSSGGSRPAAALLGFNITARENRLNKWLLFDFKTGDHLKMRKWSKESKNQAQPKPISQKPPSCLETLMKSLSKTRNKGHIGQRYKAPTQLMGKKNGKHREKVDGGEQKVCQKNKKAEKTQQFRCKWGSKRAQNSREKLSKSTAGTGR